MATQYHRSLYIFRRDLRLGDNTGLLEALKASDWVIPCFIFDPREMMERYHTQTSAQFLIESLGDLAGQLDRRGGHLYVVYGTTEQVIKKIIKEMSIDAIWVNADRGAVTHERDWALEFQCKKIGVAFQACDDGLLSKLDQMHKPDGKPHVSFAAWHNKVRGLRVLRPRKNDQWNYLQQPPMLRAQHVLKEILVTRDPAPKFRGGRGEALKLLKEIKKSSHTRKDKKQLSAHLTMHLDLGTISAREAYHGIHKKFCGRHPLERKIFKREFRTSLQQG